MLYASVLHVIWYVLNAVALEQRMYYTAFSRCVGGQGGLRYVCTAGTALCVYSRDCAVCVQQGLRCVCTVQIQILVHASDIRKRLLYAHVFCTHTSHVCNNRRWRCSWTRRKTAPMRPIICAHGAPSRRFYC